MSKLKDILHIIEELGVVPAENTEKLLELLLSGESLNETDLAEKLEIRINDVRKILYALARLDIVYYTKDKHPEKKWWYVYSWTLDVDKVYVKYIDFLNKELQDRENRLADNTTYFICKKCDRKVEYSDALVTNFKCSRCGKMLKESKRKDARLERAIKKLKKELQKYSIFASKPAAPVSEEGETKKEKKAPAKKAKTKSESKKK